MGARRASTAAVAAVAGVVLLVTVLLTWASTAGPAEVLAGDGPSAQPLTQTPTATPDRRRSAAVAPQARDTAPPTGGLVTVIRAVVAVLLLVVVLLALGALVLVLRWLWERWELRRRPPPPPPAVDFDVVGAPARVAEAITRDAGEQRAALLGGTVRNGIVECWRRFEDRAADAGIVREQWETSSELVLRVLDLVDADSRPVARLAALYREARFSDHRLDEQVRAEALAALDEIHRGLVHLGPVPR